MLTKHVGASLVGLGIFGVALFLFFANTILFSVESLSAQTSPYPIELHGHAWSSNIGWISLNCEEGGPSGEDVCGTANYNVEILSDQTLSGYAWSSNVGWIQFGSLADCPAGSCDARITGDSQTGQEVAGWARVVSGTSPVDEEVTVSVVLTSNSGNCGTKCWRVPDEWNSDNNTVYAIGGGGGGNDAGDLGHGGGGGAFASITNLSLTPGDTVTFHIGEGSPETGGAIASDGEDTWFGGANCTSASVCGKGGGGARNSSPGAGGSAASSVGTVTYSGGDGGSGHSNGDIGGGGGGAAGPDGDGEDGDDAVAYGDGGTGGAGNAGLGGAGGIETTEPSPGEDSNTGGGGGSGADYGNDTGGEGGMAGGGGGGANYTGGAGGDGIIVITYTVTLAGWDGWISLNCDNTGECGTSNYGVTVGTGSLNAYAWGSEAVGWIDFYDVSFDTCVDIGWECKEGDDTIRIYTDQWCTPIEHACTGAQICDPSSPNNCIDSTPEGEISVNPQTVRYGEQTTVSWETTNAFACNITQKNDGDVEQGNWSGVVVPDGSQASNDVFGRTHFILECTSSDGGTYIEVDSATVNVLPQTFES